MLNYCRNPGRVAILDTPSLSFPPDQHLTLLVAKPTVLSHHSELSNIPFSEGSAPKTQRSLGTSLEGSNRRVVQSSTTNAVKGCNTGRSRVEGSTKKMPNVVVDSAKQICFAECSTMLIAEPLERSVNPGTISSTRAPRRKRARKTVNPGGAGTNPTGLYTEKNVTKGVSLNQKGAALNQKGASLNQQGTSVNQQGASLNQKGASLNHLLQFKFGTRSGGGYT